MTATAQISPAVELLATLEAKAQAVTLATYQDFLHEVALLVVDGTLDPIQQGAIVTVLVNNGHGLGGIRAISTFLKGAIAQIKRDLQNPPGGIEGGRGIYSLTDHGVDYRKPVKDGYADAVTICAPLRVLAETYDTAASNNGRLLEWKDSRGRVKTWAMPSEVSAGDGMEIIKTLLSRGLQMRYGNDKEVIDYIMSSPADDLMTCTDRTGWVNDVYVTPKGAYGENAEKYIYQPVGIIDNKMGQAGTLADWQANVARYAQNNPLLMTAVSLAFAGALLDKAGMMGYGLHIWGGSSVGKSTALQSAGSVWGKEFWQQWNSTAVGIESSAHAHNDGILCIDEIAETSAQTVSATAYALANGEGRRRGDRSGNAKATKKWRLVFLSTGELSLDSMMKSAGMVTRAGQEVRMANIDCDSWKYRGFNDLHDVADGGEFSIMLKANAAKYYGTAGDAWLYAITQPGGIPEDISQAVDTIMEAMLPEGASGQVRRVARQFALTAYAGELATKHGITGWKEGEATAAAKECLLLWVDGFGGADGKREDRQIIEAVEKFLFANISRFQGTSETFYRGNKERVGFVRNNPGEDGAFIIPTGQLTQLAEGYSKEQIITALRMTGMLNEPGKDGKSAVSEWIATEKKSMRVYTITTK